MIEQYLRQRRFFLLPLLLLAMAATPAQAQREWNIWYFGEYAGVDFNTGLPVALGNGMMRQLEGCASIAHPRTGKLLFYTSGDTVWNALHRPMPNGWKLKSSAPNWTSSQSAIIVPYPRDTNRYFIFTADCGEYWDGSHPTTGISYSIVDMRADNGLGDVVVKNVNIMPKATEKLAFTRHANGRDFWVVVHEFGNQNFWSFLVTPAGVNPTPVISTTGYPHAGDPFNNIGVMKISPNGKKLALAIWYEGVAELLDFNNRTGQVSNPIQLPTDGLEYGLSFSPDNSKLYVSRANRSGSAIHQYDISSNSPLLIIASRIKIADFAPNELGDLQIGPDRKIYVAQGNSVWLGVIHSPNAGGLGCNYQANGVMLAVSSNIRRGSYLGLPNVLLTDPAGIDPQLVPPVARFTPSRQAICAGESITFTDLSLENPTSWQWFFPGGSPAVSSEQHPQNIEYSTPGEYEAMLVASSPKGTDTARIQITVNPLPAIAVGNGAQEVSICAGSSIQLNATGGVSFQWSPAQGLSCTDCANPMAKPAQTTIYTVTGYDASGCWDTDTITVAINPAPAILHAHIERHYRPYPGTRINVPIVIDESLDGAGVTEIIVTVNFEPAMLQLVNGGVGLTNTLLAGTLLDGWLAIPLDTANGKYRVRLIAPPGQTLGGGAGALLKLRFQTYLGYPPTSELPFDIELVGAGCTRVITSPGFVKLDSVCGLNLRLITIGVDDYALDQNRPNPFNPTTDIPFSLGLDGPTELTIHDASGREVATLVKQHLSPGKYQVTWDATGFPSGLYYCRLTSGHWNKVQTMMLVK
ncbi:MAG: carboxypeptidase [Chlorobi bacterium OLB7]|nr:MAG: carboxypeptidase [Chlorobi bacterium OLB7]